jgi:hypothetical protein
VARRASRTRASRAAAAPGAASSRTAAPRPAAPSAAARDRFPLPRFLRNLALAALPVVFVWLLATPFYNRFLASAGANLVHWTESPNVTTLTPALEDRHTAWIDRADFPPARRRVASLRLTDLHFPLILLGALFLAVPGVPWRERLANLGWALLATVFFHLALVLFHVKFVYATQLGAWSFEHYGAFARNFWGLGKHLLDLPVKLALPLALWVGFHYPRLLPRGA